MTAEEIIARRLNRLTKLTTNDAARHAGYRYELRPTSEQAAALWRTFAHCRSAYNHAVGRRRDLWQHEGESISLAELDAEWTDVKSRKPWFFDTSSVSQQQAIRDAHRAYVNWWEKRARAPRFKPKKIRHRWSSARFTRSGFSLRDTDDGRVLHLGKIGEIQVLWSRDLPSDPSSVTVRCTPSGRWFASFQVEVSPEQLPSTDEAVGIDLGIGDRLWTTSDGEVVHNPRALRRRERHLKRTQRAASRKQVGSRRHKRAKRRAAKIHAKVADQRRDHQHKATTALVQRAHVATQADRPKAWMRTKLAKSTADAAPGRSVTMVDYKADWYGRKRGQVGTFVRTTGVCPDCSAKTKLGLGDRDWTCPSCGVEWDRDLASARVIAVLAQWDAGRDTKDAASVSAQEVQPPDKGAPQEVLA